MGFQRRNKRITNRHSFKQPADNTLQSNIIRISLDAMVLKFGVRSDCHFKRLNYKGCPPLVRQNSSVPSDAADMNRQDFVLGMYSLFKDFSVYAETGNGHFSTLIAYVRCMDQHTMTANLSDESVLFFLEYNRILCQQGELGKKSIITRQSSIAAIIKAQGRIEFARKLPSIKGRRTPRKPVIPLSDEEVSNIGAHLLSAYKNYSRAVKQGTKPEYCFLYSEERLRRLEYSESEIKKIKGLAERQVWGGNWRNRLTSLAFLIISMWTGANLTPLMNMRRKDIVFKKEKGGYYELDVTKSRALYKNLELEAGFTKPLKRFLKDWLDVTAILAPKPDDKFFPFFGRNGSIKENSALYRAPQRYINDALAVYKYPSLGARKYRKTLSNALTRAYDDIFINSGALGNSPEVVARHYTNGVEEQQQIQIAGAMHAQREIAIGTPKEEAIDKVIYKYRDPLTLIDWGEKHNHIPNKTPTGFRCTESFGKKAKRSLAAAQKKGFETAKDGACIDFLGCFECKHHALIAEKDDIWLMMSFKDTIVESKSRPSLNSIPEGTLDTVLNTVNEILDNFKAKNQAGYNAASELNKRNAHPLWDDENALEDTLGLYQ